MLMIEKRKGQVESRECLLFFSLIKTVERKWAPSSLSRDGGLAGALVILGLERVKFMDRSKLIDTMASFSSYTNGQQSLTSPCMRETKCFHVY